MKSILKSLKELIITILRLKDTGKWVSIITIGIVLFMYYRFLVVNEFGYAAFSLVAPHLKAIAITVFSIIGGFKGIPSIIEKIKK